MGRKKMPAGTTQAEKNALKRELKRPSRGPEELTIYASGCGALSFCWQAEERTPAGITQRIATGRPVTMDDARTFMRTHRRGHELVQDGWKLWGGSGGPYAIAPVERTGPDTIKMGDGLYRYTIDQTDPFYIRDKEVRQVSLRLEILDEAFADLPIGLRSVKNWGTLSSAAFFLTHEKDIAAQPPETFTYEVALA